jgi:hypothetical protein
MRPLGKGIPRRPATPVVRPRRKISQWNPGGLRRGNSLPWAIRDDTVGFGQWTGDGDEVKKPRTVMIEVEENR